MKLVSYLHEGRSGWGVVQGTEIVSGTQVLDGRFPTLRAVIEAGALDDVRQAARTRTATLALDDVTLSPVIPDPDKILCAGLNYRSHIEETGRTPPKYPRFFARLNNSILGHGAPMVRPQASTHFDFEGELAIIIGRRGRHISEEDALDHIAGYTCFMDGSVRDYQEHTTTSGKNFHATGPLGPWMVTADEIPDPTTLTLTTRLNGEIVQQSGTDRLIYSIPTMINYLSTITWLEPGDVIATGTPDGVGSRRQPPLWMKAGDVIEVEISKIGLLRNPIIDESTNV